MTASDFICGLFFIFSIIKNFRNENRRFIQKKSTSGKPAFFVTNIFDNGKYEKQIKSEAVIQRCSINKVFLEISQNSQENICARVSFLINVQP